MERECEADLTLVNTNQSEGELFGERGGVTTMTAFIDCDKCQIHTRGVVVDTRKEAIRKVMDNCPLKLNKDYEI